MGARRDAALTAAVIALLRTLTGDQLLTVLTAVDAQLRTALPGDTSARRPRLCGVCREPYPRCRALWADDHEWEEPPKPGPRPGLDQADEAETCCPATALDVSGGCTSCGTVVS